LSFSPNEQGAITFRQRIELIQLETEIAVFDSLKPSQHEIQCKARIDYRKYLQDKMSSINETPMVRINKEKKEADRRKEEDCIGLTVFVIIVIFFFIVLH
jgi:hypothetical protein